MKFVYRIIVLIIVAMLIPISIISIQYLHTIYVFKNTIQCFEEAIVSNDQNEINKYTTTKYNLLIQNVKYHKQLLLFFDKFNKGTTYNSCKRFSGNEKSTGKEEIIGNCYKTAKKDNNPRCFYEISLIKEKGNWKVDKYTFPDIVDY